MCVEHVNISRTDCGTANRVLALERQICCADTTVAHAAACQLRSWLDAKHVCVINSHSAPAHVQTPIYETAP